MMNDTLNDMTKVKCTISMPSLLFILMSYHGIKRKMHNTLKMPYCKNVVKLFFNKEKKQELNGENASGPLL